MAPVFSIGFTSGTLRANGFHTCNAAASGVFTSVWFRSVRMIPVFRSAPDAVRTYPCMPAARSRSVGIGQSFPRPSLSGTLYAAT